MYDSQEDVFTPSQAALLTDEPAAQEVPLALTPQERQALLREMSALVARLHGAA